MHQLRCQNTELLSKMVLNYLNKLVKNKKIYCQKNKKGKYYSFMPSELKKIVEKKFNNHTQKIK